MKEVKNILYRSLGADISNDGRMIDEVNCIIEDA